MFSTIVTEYHTTTGPSSMPRRRRYPGLGRRSRRRRYPGLGRKLCQETKAFLGSRRKERREDSDDAGVRGHIESPKDSPRGEHMGWLAEPRSEPDPIWEKMEKLEESERSESETVSEWMEILEERERRELLSWWKMHAFALRSMLSV